MKVTFSTLSTQSMTFISDLLDLMVARVQYDQQYKPDYNPAAEYSAEHCVDSDLRTKCKSSDTEHPGYPSAIKLELQGSTDYEIKSVTIYSPFEDQSYQPEGHNFQVEAQIYLQLGPLRPFLQSAGPKYMLSD